jgi:hypothetical protein
MRDLRNAVRLVLPLAAAALLLAGCGSSSSSTNAGATSAPSGGTQSSAASMPSDTASTPAAGGGNDFCATIVAEKKELTSNELPALLQGGKAPDWKKYLEATAAMNDKLYEAAPAEIKGAVDQLRQVNVKLNETLSAAGYDITKLKSTDLLKVITSADYRKASAEFASYVKTNCSLDLSKP